MPSTHYYGDMTGSSPGNKAVGGVPVMLYFDFQSRGRAQVVRLMWEDADISYTDIRYTFEEYPSFKSGELLTLNPLDTIPVVKIGEKTLTQSYAMLRHFSRLLGNAYDGETEDEIYWVDAMCDVCIDWRTAFVAAFLSDNAKEDYPKHKEGARKGYVKGMEEQLKRSELSKRGPYVIGWKCTYADFVLYQVCHDERLVQEGRKGLQEYPRLRELVDAVEGREGVKRFLQSDRYRG